MNKNISHICVEEFTTPVLAHVLKDTDLSTIEKILTSNKIRHLPVLDNELVVGIISERDVRGFKFYKNKETLKAKDIMIENPFSVHIDTDLKEVVFEMSKRKIGSALVHDDNSKLVGIFTSTDALNALLEILRGENFESNLTTHTMRGEN